MRTACRSESSALITLGSIDVGTIGIGTIGIGTMGLSPGVYGDVTDTEAIDVVRRALDAGVRLVDTADAYGGGENEKLVGRAIANRRDDVVLATKFGYVGPDQGRRIDVGYRMKLFVDGSPEHVANAVDASLHRLGTDHIDLWYLHFPDPEVPITETVGAMAEQVTAGKVGHIGLSNVDATQLRAAADTHPIAAVQGEYSLWHRDAERELLPACRELGTGFVAWGPLGSGFLADARFLDGDGSDVPELPRTDFRSRNPRFAPENLPANADRFAPLRTLAARTGRSTSQLALAWLLAQDVVPIPGTRNPDHLAENLAATDVTLSAAELAEIDALFPPGAAAGGAFQEV